MTTEEKEEWIDKIADIAYELEDLKQLAEDAIETETDTVKEWKKKVIDSIPKKCSLKFRMDVEELLEKFKTVY
jgi:hypothetical protein